MVLSILNSPPENNNLLISVLKDYKDSVKEVYGPTLLASFKNVKLITELFTIKLT